MKTYVNASDARRVWPNIQVPTTGQTLELGPGETAYLDLPDDFSDFALVPAPTSKAAPASTPAPAPTEEAS